MTQDWQVIILQKYDVKRSATNDRKKRLESSLINGDWDGVRRLRQGGKQEKRGRLRDADGKLVASDQRAETIAQYLERVQWAVKFPDLVQSNDRMFDSDLRVDTSPFQADELHKVVSRCKRDKASRCDDIPAEFWKALSNSEARSSLLQLCNLIWERKSLPNTWKHASVMTFFKKGVTSEPINYRPISFLTLRYKILAGLVLQRFQQGGVEER
jgi:hypothetical protein